MSPIEFRGFQVPTETGRVHLAHVLIDFALNPERRESIITDCATGWAATQEEAINEAVDAWMKTTCPPVFSFLKCQPVMGPEWFPSGDPDGIPGWDVFASPCTLRGETAERQCIQEVLEGRSLMRELAQEINTAATREVLNQVKIYHGFDGERYHVECTVNGVRDDATSHKLQRIAWLQPKLHRFVSLSEFLLLIKPMPTA